MSYKIAITGTIGTGKSTIRHYLQEKGYSILDVDVVNRTLLENPYVLLELENCFGSDIIENGILNKHVLRDYIFTDFEKKQRLEAILHPKILAEVQAFVASHPNQIIFVEVPLLYESGWDCYFDEVWLLYVEETKLKERLKEERGYSEEVIQGFLDKQMKQEEKVKRADVIIDNSNDKSTLFRQIDDHLRGLNERRK